MEERAQVFERNRRLLEGVAYRMLGTLADARDVVQDTYLKWSEADVEEVRDARAWLVTVCSRLALNTLQSARVRREEYVGMWLPEPLPDDRAWDPAAQSELDETVSIALMLALETLTPPERAAFLLHEVFGFTFDEVGEILGRTSAACRKLASRARIAVRNARPRYTASPAEHRRLVTAFLSAARAGDLSGLQSLLAQGVELHADSGGKAITARDVLHGADAVTTFLIRVWRDSALRYWVGFESRSFNGAPGILIYEDDRLVAALSITTGEGAIQRIYAHRNPDKLALLT